MLETVLTISGVDVVTKGVAGVAQEVLRMAGTQANAANAASGLKAAQQGLAAQIAPMIAQTQGLAAATLNAAVVAVGATTATTAQAAATVALAGAMALLQSPLVLITLGLLALFAAFKFIGAATAAFSRLQDAAFRAGIIINNVKGAASFDQVTAAVNKTADAAGMSRAEFYNLAAVVSKYGVTAKELPGVLDAVADAAAGSGRSVEEVGRALGHALLPGGRTMMFSQIVGAEFKKTGDRAKDMAKAIELIESKFGGGAAGRRNNLSGAMDALHESFANLGAQIGRVFSSPIWIRVINALADYINHIAGNLERLLNIMNALTFGAFAGNPNAAGGVGGKNKGDPEQTALLEEIAGNTSKLDDLVKGVFGESGEAARTGFSLRDARMAFGI